MKKYIFLDIDGVIATPETVIGGMWALTPSRQQLLGRILKETGAKIVLSSSWRKNTLEDTIQYMKNKGFLFCDDVIGITIRAYDHIKRGVHLSIPRGVEIKQWLDTHVEYPWYADRSCQKDHEIYDENGNFKKLRGNKYGIDFSYVIIDDDGDMLLEHRNNFIKTNGMIGMTKRHANEAIKILNQFDTKNTVKGEVAHKA